MAMLPSGLPEQVADDEDLSRFLTQSSHYRRNPGDSYMAKPAAFLPNPKTRNSSVFRIGNETERLRQIFEDTQKGDRTLKGLAFFKAADVRAANLEVIPEEKPPELPPAHANIEGWPWLDHDPELQKAQQKDLANLIASKADALVF